MSITVNDFLDEVEKNGYEQYFGSLIGDPSINDWHQVEPSKVKTACAVGQGYLNIAKDYQQSFEAVVEGMGLFPTFSGKNVKCPLFTPHSNLDESYCHKYTQFNNVFSMVVHLNDEHHASLSDIVKMVREHVNGNDRRRVIWRINKP